MATTNYRSPLRKRYSALTGKRDELSHRIKRIKSDIEKLPDLEGELRDMGPLIDAVTVLLKDDDPSWTPEETPPLKPWTHHIPIPLGQCGRRAMAVLRESSDPMTARQVALKVLEDVGVAEPSSENLQRVVNTVDSTFRKFRGRTTESSGLYPAQWRAINKPEIEFDP